MSKSVKQKTKANRESLSSNTQANNSIDLHKKKALTILSLRPQCFNRVSPGCNISMYPVAVERKTCTYEIIHVSNCVNYNVVSIMRIVF